MAENVEGLVIEIESQAQGAVSQLDMLNERLVELKKVTGASASLATFSKNFKTFTSTFNTENSFAGLNQYTEAMSKLSAMSNFKLNKSGINNLEYIAQVANGLGGEPLNSLERFAIAMERLSAMSGFKFSKTIVTNLQSLSEMAKKLDASSIKNLDSFTSALSRLQVLSEVDTRSMRELSSSMKTFSSATRGATTRGRTFNTVLANIRAKTIVMYTALTRVARGMTKSLSVYGDYVEALNLYKMAMGEAAEEGYNFAETAQRLLGIDLTQWMQAQGVFMALAKGFGVANEKAALMSQNLTQLAYDISSFYNISVEDAIQKVQSGFAGQIRPVRNLGYDLSQARLEAIALANGIDEEVKSMTQAEKSQLRYIALMTQLTEVQGDLARTLDSPTNQLRLLNAQLDQMMRSVGMVLLPLLNKIIPYLNAILRVIKMIADEIAAMFGYTLPRISGGDWSKNISIGADELEEDLEDANGAAEKLKNTLASFDQINLITSKSGGSGSGSGASVGGSDLGLDLPSYDFFGDVNENKAQKIAESIMKSIRPVVDVIKGIILFVVDNFDTIVQIVETFAAVTIGKKLLGQIAGLFNLTNTEMEKFNKFIGGLSLIVIGVQFSFLGGKDIAKGNVLEGFIKSALGIGTATLGGFKMAGPVGAVVGFTLSVVTTIAGYFSGKSENLRKECYDMFYGIKQDAKMLDEVAESWNKFVETYTDPALLDKYNTADAMQKDVEGIQKAVGDLMAQYATGSLTVAGYAGALTGLYEQLETATVKHMKAVDEAILASLNGPLGVYLESRCYDIKSLISIFQETTDDYASMLEKNRLKMQEYQHYIDEGIQVEHYKKKMEKVIEENNKIYQSMEKLDDSTTTTFDKFKNIKINLENFDDFKATMDEIEKVYVDATTSITTQLELQRQKTDQVLLDPNRTEAEKQFAKDSLAIAEEYWNNQLEKVNGAYLDLVRSFENQAAFNWEDVYNIHGVKIANETLSGEMSKFDEIFEEAYGVANKERADNFFTKLIDYQKEWDALLSDKRSTSQFKAKRESWHNDVDAMERRYKELVDSCTENDSKIKMSNSNMLNILRNNFIKDEEIARHYAEVYGNSMNSVNKAAKESTEYLNIKTDQVAKKYMDLSYLFGDEELLADPLYSTMVSTANVMGSSPILNAFAHGADALMGKVSSEIYGSKNAVQKAYFGALDMPTKQVVDIGGGLGLAIAKGMKDSAPEIQKSTQYAMGAAAKEVNKFGDGLGDFFRDIAKAFNDSFASGLTNVFGQTSTYTLPKIKTPRVKGYATGGFPDSADFFYANENGVPEFVGTMGGRTAVANNQEITKGVADGVYKAIRDTGLIGDVRKIASKDGRVVFAPSEEAGRVMSQSVNMYNGTGGRY